MMYRKGIPGNYSCLVLHLFLKALLPIAKRRTPAPSRIRVTGQGNGKSGDNGLGIPVNINIESRINNAPAIIKSHFDIVNMISLLTLRSLFIGSMLVFLSRDIKVRPSNDNIFVIDTHSMFLNI